MIVRACWAGAVPREEHSAWKLMRSQPRARDLTLAPEAEAWLGTLPWTMQPRELSARYPRIVNRMALVWPDAHLTALYFRSLLDTDGRREHRRGFPTVVADELMALRSYHADLRGVRTDHEQWVSRLLAELRELRGRAEAALGVPSAIGAC